MSNLFDTLNGTLVVSCQASFGDPLENVDALRRIALTAIKGGAGGLRLNSAECIAAIRPDTNLPIIGIKKVSGHGRVRITPDFASAAELARAGANIIALDCTNRSWTGGEPWRKLIQRIHDELHVPVLADISTLQEAIDAADAGADSIGTTLRGYTEATRGVASFDWHLLADLLQRINRPIIAEGRISTPAEARRAIMAGALCVVVGSAITRPGEITSSFVEAIRSSPRYSNAIGVDIGGTSIKAGLVDRNGRVSFERKIPTNTTEGHDAIVSAASQAIHEVLNTARDKGIEPIGLGIASAGIIDSRTGTVVAATNDLPGLDGFDLRTFAETSFNLPVRIENAGHAAALAELWFGAARNTDNFVSLTIGTGVHGGVVVDRQLVRGKGGFAGGFGHLTIRKNGRPCTCGRVGCLEAYVSVAALEFEYQASGGCYAQGPSVKEISLAQTINNFAEAGDPPALDAYSKLAGYLAEGIGIISDVLDPDVIFLAGGLVEANQQQFLERVQRSVGEFLQFGELRGANIRLATAGDQVGLLGAAASVFMSLER